MDRTRILRGVRITVSVSCLILCGLLIALWVRSYWWIDDSHLSTPQNTLLVGSLRGRLVYGIGGPSDRVEIWESFTLGNDLVQANYDERYLAWRWRPNGESVVPHWFLVISTAALAVLPWIKWRFSLRTLLIGMTLVAVGLGIIVATM